MKSIYNDVELLTVREVAGILRMSTKTAYQFIHALHPGAIIRSGRGNRILVHAQALWKYLQMEEKCPGCGRPWPKED